MRLCAFEKCFCVIKLTDVGYSLCCAELQPWISGEAIGGLGIGIRGLFSFASQLVCVGRLGKGGTALGHGNCFLHRRNGNIVLVTVSIKGRDRSGDRWIVLRAPL